MKKFIDIDKTGMAFICRAMKCTERMVREAVSFRSDSDLAVRIRRLAMQRGNVVMVELPEMETIHDSEGMMRQYLGNGAMIEWDKNSGNATVRMGGRTAAKYDDIKLSEMGAIQRAAMNLR